MSSNTSLPSHKTFKSERAKRAGTLKVLCFGTFDGVHPGHIFFFTQCKNLGDHLTVVIARDSTVEEVKHRKPHFNEAIRQEAVQSVPVVDLAVLGDPIDKYKIIKSVHPDIICLGYDQKVFVDKLEGKLEEFGLHPRIVRIQSFKPEIYKSSIMKSRTSKSILRPKSR